MSDINNGWKFTKNNNSVYIIPQAIRELKKNEKGSNIKHYMDLISSWIESDTHPTSNCKKLQGKEKDLYELKKHGTQARFLGFYQGTDFFVLKCIKKKRGKLERKDIETTIERKRLFNKHDIQWEEL